MSFGDIVLVLGVVVAICGVMEVVDKVVGFLFRVAE